MMDRRNKPDPLKMGSTALEEENQPGKHLPHLLDIYDIRTTLTPTEQTRDKITFMAYCVLFVLSGFILGHWPQYYYIFHSILACIILPLRWVLLRKLNMHYYFLNFCYFNNALVLFYLWVPTSVIGDHWKGTLNTCLFALSFGPMLQATFVFRNSFVPHSSLKMQQIFLHVSPAAALWGLRWYSTEDQGFSLCHSATVYGPEGCEKLKTRDYWLLEMSILVIWHIVYAILIFGLLRKRIERHKHLTMFQVEVERPNSGYFYRMCNIFGKQYAKLMFFVMPTLSGILNLFPTPIYWHVKVAGTAMIVLALAFDCYNGASFYTDVFSKRYYYETVLKIPPPTPGFYIRMKSDQEKEK